MYEMIKFMAGFVVVYFLLSLLDLPDWINQYVRRGKSRRKLEKRLGELEARIARLENN